MWKTSIWISNGLLVEIVSDDSRGSPKDELTGSWMPTSTMKMPTSGNLAIEFCSPAARSVGQLARAMSVKT